MQLRTFYLKNDRIAVAGPTLEKVSLEDLPRIALDLLLSAAVCDGVEIWDSRNRLASVRVDRFIPKAA